MSLPQIFNFETNDVRTFNIDGDPWFVLMDTCSILGLRSSDVRQRLSDDVVSNHPVTDSLGRRTSATIINEDGLYDVILDSRKPEAKKFRKWITSEVIPMIRKTGGYVIPQTMPETLRLLAAEIEKNQAIEAENRQLALQAAAQDQKLQEQATPVAIYNLAISAHNTMSMQEVAKSLNTGRTRLYQILRAEGVIMKDSTLPYQRFLDAGHFKVTERPRASGDAIVNDPATRVTAKGFDYIARLLHKRSESQVS
jgi:anti-repressor protein